MKLAKACLLSISVCVFRQNVINTCQWRTEYIDQIESKVHPGQNFDLRVQLYHNLLHDKATSEVDNVQALLVA